MSSTAYSTELRPDRRLRRAVQISGLVATILGLVVILSMPVDGRWRAGVSLAWLLFGLRELRTIRVAYSRYCRIRIDAVGDIDLETTSGDRHAGRLLPGSVVLPGLAWLRLAAADGPVFGEFLLRNAQENKQWRRLQVIWRHFGAAG